MKRILITPGEPAGIGPDIVIKIAQQKWPVELVVVGDPDLLKHRAKQLNLSLGKLVIIPVLLNTPCKAGILNPANADYVMRCLNLAADMSLTKQVDAWVTGPVHKSNMNDGGFSFTGHTEFLADFYRVKQVIMLFVTPQTKVALVTTHIPLKQVSDAITKNKLDSVLRLLHDELRSVFKINQPRILVSGLNPHAGENGHLGTEEIDIIEPVIRQLQTEGLSITGPFSADTLFTEKYLCAADAILAMFHDQALPVVKTMSFGHAVNITLGLPIIRTSVDHGTALDMAGTGNANAESLAAAIELAITLLS